MFSLKPWMRFRTPRRRLLPFALSVALLCGACAWMSEGTPAAAQQEKAQKKRRGGGPPMPEPFSDDTSGFQSLFDGTTLNGWEGDTAFWRAEGGAIVGETTAENPLKSNTFLIWSGGEPKDFELLLKYRINSTNSGIQYRSSRLPDVGEFVLKGYQADIDAGNRYTGQIYEERGRGFLALRGQYTHIGDGLKPRVMGALGDGAALAELISADWNKLRIVARGNTLIQVLNGQVMSVVVDDDVKNRALEGLLGIQIHVGPPMKIEVRELWLKTL
jgi:hypothetical protein